MIAKSSVHSRESGNEAARTLGPRLRGDERLVEPSLNHMTAREPFPWDEAIGFGLGVLRLSPAAFWAMTPRELALAIAALRGGLTPPLRRADLNALMTRYPDGR